MTRVQADALAETVMAHIPGSVVMRTWDGSRRYVLATVLPDGRHYEIRSKADLRRVATGHRQEKSMNGAEQ